LGLEEFVDQKGPNGTGSKIRIRLIIVEQEENRFKKNPSTVVPSFDLLEKLRNPQSHPHSVPFFDFSPISSVQMEPDSKSSEIRPVGRIPEQQIPSSIRPVFRTTPFRLDPRIPFRDSTHRSNSRTKKSFFNPSRFSNYFVPFKTCSPCFVFPPISLFYRGSEDLLVWERSPLLQSASCPGVWKVSSHWEGYMRTDPQQGRGPSEEYHGCL